MLIALYTFCAPGPATAAALAEKGVMVEPGGRVCVGHFVLEFPVEAKVRVAGSYRGIRVKRAKPAGFDEMVDELGAKAEQMEDRKVEQDPRAAALYRSGGVDPESLFGEAQLLGFDSDEKQTPAVLGYHDEPGKPSIVVELHRIYGQERYVLRTDQVGADRYGAVRDGMLGAASRFQPLHGSRMPEDPGFCVGEGLFAEDGMDDTGGDATLVATFSEYRGVIFSIDVGGVVQTSREGGLRGWVGRGMKRLAQVGMGVRTLRSGVVHHAGRRGRLIAISADDEGERVQKFFWRAEGIPGDARRPAIEIQLLAGESGPSPLEEEQLCDLWDRLLAGLSQHPGAI